MNDHERTEMRRWLYAYLNDQSRKLEEESLAKGTPLSRYRILCEVGEKMTVLLPAMIRGGDPAALRSPADITEGERLFREVLEELKRQARN